MNEEFPLKAKLSLQSVGMLDGLVPDLSWNGGRMDRVRFRDWFSNIDELTAAQRREVAAV